MNYIVLTKCFNLYFYSKKAKIVEPAKVDQTSPMSDHDNKN